MIFHPQVIFAELAAHLHASGTTAYDHLQSLYDK